MNDTIAKSPTIDLNFGDVNLKFHVFIDQDGLERGCFEIDVKEGVVIKYKGKEYEPYRGTFYINNLYRLYQILYEGKIQSKVISNYSSKIKKGNQAGHSFNIRRARINQNQRSQILKDYYNFYVNGLKDKIEVEDNEPEPEVNQEEETIFDIPILDLNAQEQMKLTSAQISPKHVEAIHNVFKKLPYDLDMDMYTVFPSKFLRRHSIVSVYYAFFPNRRLILEFRDNKTPIKYTRIFLEMHHILTFIDLIETFLQNVHDRKRAVYPPQNNTDNGKPNPLLINKEGDIRKLSIIPFLSQESVLDFGGYLLLKNSLKDYIETGIVPKVQINNGISFFIGEKYPYISLSGKKFKIEGRKHALEILYNLL